MTIKQCHVTFEQNLKWHQPSNRMYVARQPKPLISICTLVAVKPLWILIKNLLVILTPPSSNLLSPVLSTTFSPLFDSHKLSASAN